MHANLIISVGIRLSGSASVIYELIDIGTLVH